MSLFEVLKPLLVEEYYSVGAVQGLTLDEYLSLRCYELSANEIRFPGFNKHYVKKIKHMRRISIAGIFFGVGSVLLHLLR
jgi:hypothetical protein